MLSLVRILGPSTDIMNIREIYVFTEDYIVEFLHICNIKPNDCNWLVGDGRAQGFLRKIF